jgi:hypothetical protein
MKKIILLLLAFNFVFAYIGKIAALKGDATILRNNNSIKATLGMKIDSKDIIKTKNAHLQIIFQDRTIITIGKNSEFKIEDYIFNDKNQKMDFRLSRGLIKTITGKISKIAPQRFHIKTKNAIIGIRGTIFVVEFKNNITKMTTIEGITSFKDLATNQTFIVKKGEQITLNPTTPKKVIKKKIETLPQVIQPITTNTVKQTNTVTNNLVEEIKQLQTATTTTKEVEEIITLPLTKQTFATFNNYTLGYNVENDKIVSTWIDTTIPITTEENLNNLISSDIQAFYSGNLLAIIDNQTIPGWSTLSFEFGNQMWHGEFLFGKDMDNLWHFYTEGSFGTNGLVTNYIDTAYNSAAKNITGSVTGNLYGKDVSLVAGEGDVVSDNLGEAVFSFGAIKENENQNYYLDLILDDNNQPVDTYYYTNEELTDSAYIENLINNDISASYIGSILAITDNGVAAGITNLTFDFANEQWYGDFNFNSSNDTNWHFSANGELTSNTFSANEITTLEDSSATNIKGSLTGSIYGKDASIIGGHASLTSDNQGNANLSFGANLAQP